MLVLALIPLRKMSSGPFTLFFSSGNSTEIGEFALFGTDNVAFDEPMTIDDSTVAPSTATELLKLDLVELSTLNHMVPNANSNTMPLDKIARALSGRSGSAKERLLARYGGTAATEDAVELGLAWLAKQQKSDGSWSLKGPYSNGGTFENSTAATALALNAFLGAGHTHRGGKYADEVLMGLKYLLKQQDEDGFFANAAHSRQQMYAQAIATITVIEAYALTGDSEMRIAADKAISFAQWSQSKLNGWRYEPREDADLSVTGWFLMALETGKMAGLGVDNQKIEVVSKFLDSVSYEQDSRYAYNLFEEPSLSMTAEGLFCRIILGWPKTHPALLRAIDDDLLRATPELGDEVYSVYFWYYATQVLHHVGGPAWDEWNNAMRRVLPSMQTKEGDEIGSWDPSRDAHGTSGGRLYTTCFNIFCLEVYYRHLSIYDL
ncbi:MAG: squalene--hopene cyclase [Pirellulaceae bacterium]